MLKKFLGSQFNLYISGSSIRRVHSDFNYNSATTAATYSYDPRNLGLPAPVVELPTGTFHKNGGQGHLQEQGATLHSVLHEGFHVYELGRPSVSGEHILRSFGNVAGWDMPSAAAILSTQALLCGSSLLTDTPCRSYREILVNLSTKGSDSGLTLSDYGAGARKLHEDFAETSAQFAELWLMDNGFPRLASAAYSVATEEQAHLLEKNEQFEDMVKWLERLYGRQIRTEYQRTP